jgi:hypothetical protein
MVGLFCKSFPLGKIVRSLLFHIGLCVDTMLASELLSDRILDFDSFHFLF